MLDTTRKQKQKWNAFERFVLQDNVLSEWVMSATLWRAPLNVDTNFTSIHFPRIYKNSMHVCENKSLYSYRIIKSPPLSFCNKKKIEKVFVIYLWMQTPVFVQFNNIIHCSCKPQSLVCQFQNKQKKWLLRLALARKTATTKFIYHANTKRSTNRQTVQKLN